MECIVHNYIKANSFDEPKLVLHLKRLEENYARFVEGMPGVNVHYAVKANPHVEILSQLHAMGSKFDAASIGEITQLIDLDVPPEHISFGNTVKAVSAIKAAHILGITLYAADSYEEVEKIAEHAPGADVYIRLLVRSTEAEWPLSRKFGCSSSMVVPIMDRAKALGLNPIGLSFHVGSQTRHPHMWLDILDIVSSVWIDAKDAGHTPSLLNIGGGFPSYYGVDITDPITYGRTLTEEIEKRFDGVSYLMAEPGRAMVANLGSIAAEVLLVSHKTEGDPVRWVYLNIGRFSGLAETEEEAIKYRLFVPGKDLEHKTECILAGPTCDSADVMYEDHKLLLPESLRCGDKVIIDNTGAYTLTYSTVAFNGFPPLGVILI